MNLINKPVESLDKLPKRDKKHIIDPWDYDGRDYPYKKVKNFLSSRIGQNWNKVASEFLSLTWVPRQYRLISKLSEMVEINTFLNKAGAICFHANCSWKSMFGEEIEVNRYETFYVHPVTKVLCYYKPKKINWAKRRRDEEAKSFKYLSPYLQCLKINGRWFKYWIDDTPLVRKHIKPDENFTMVSGYRGNGIWFYKGVDSLIVKIYKKSLNSKELKQYGLKNDLR